MTRRHGEGEGLRDEGGLVGKVILLWLLLLAVIVVLAIDAGSILLLRYRTAEAANDAATAAALAVAEGGGEEAAKLAALAAIADAGERMRLKRIAVRPDEVTVVVVARAGTIVVGRIPFFDDLANVTITESESSLPG